VRGEFKQNDEKREGKQLFELAVDLTVELDPMG
jgi:hypothetical protein